MDIHQLHAFRDELEKLAGMELNLVGYKSDPTLTGEQRAELDRVADESRRRARSMAKTKYPNRKDFEESPGFFGRLIGRRPKFDQAGFDAQRAAHSAEMQGIYRTLGSLPMDSYLTTRSLRAGPEDRTSGKLTSYVLGDAISDENLDTDEAYSDTPYSRYLNDKQLDKVVSLYKRDMANYDRPGDAEYHQRFLDRAAALKKDPSVKGYRIEWG